jgi:predicted solute-binding protein
MILTYFNLSKHSDPKKTMIQNNEKQSEENITRTVSVTINSSSLETNDNRIETVDKVFQDVEKNEVKKKKSKGRISACMHFSLVYKSKVKEKKGKSSTQRN